MLEIISFLGVLQFFFVYFSSLCSKTKY